MATQMIFFRKNWADFEKTYVTVTASEGSAVALNILDRSNRTAWGTSGSVDANNTQLVIGMGDVGTIDSILLLKHNFKNFLLEYWDDINSLWLAFATPIHPTTCTDASSYFSFPSIQTSQIRLTIYGTQVVDSDKYLFQFIATSKLGQLAGWPIFKKPTLARNIVEQQMLSGKSNITLNVGYYSTTLSIKNWSLASDLAIIESLYGNSEGFLFWPCGGDQSQFSSVRQGYRLEDIYLVRCKNEYTPEWANGYYQQGLALQISLIEVIT